MRVSGSSQMPCYVTDLMGRLLDARCWARYWVLGAGCWVLGALLGAGCWVLGASVSAEVSADQLARALQKKYDGIKDFTADFVHAYEGGVLKTRITERGRVLIKKPGKMRWEYSAPEEKLFVSDGLKIYSYIPQDKQVIVGSIPQGGEAATPTLFLTGKGDLTRDFTPSLVDLMPGLPPGTRALKLVPKSPQREYDWLILAIEPESLAIRGLATVDAQGGTSTFSFTHLQENVGLSDKEFTFKIPRGVDIVKDSSFGG
jgi:outer membrane lipoprotein carrier protein